MNMSNSNVTDSYSYYYKVSLIDNNDQVYIRQRGILIN